MKTALLLVDIQNDYFPGGNMELEGSIEASLCAKKLLSYFRDKKLPIIHIQHISVRPGSTFFIPNTKGVEIHENVLPAANEVVFQKNYPNSFRETPLLDHLQSLQIKRLVVCGMMTHMCIDATVRAAFDLGFVCMTAEDACASRTLVFKETTIPANHVHCSFLSALSAVYSKVLKTEELIAELKVEG